MLHVFKALVRNMVQSTHPGIGLTNPFVGFEVYTRGMGLTNPIVGFEVYTLRMGLSNPIVGFKLYTLGWGISKSKPLDSKITHSLRSLSRLCTRDRNSCRLIEYYWDDVHYGLCFSCIPLKVDGNLCVAFHKEHTWGGKRTPITILFCAQNWYLEKEMLVTNTHPMSIACDPLLSFTMQVLSRLQQQADFCCGFGFLGFCSARHFVSRRLTTDTAKKKK
jgi:hypothetical protein